MQVGTTKDQGLYNKPSATVHRRALAGGTLLHNITYLYITNVRGYVQSVVKIFVACNFFISAFDNRQYCLS